VDCAIRAPAPTRVGAQRNRLRPDGHFKTNTRLSRTRKSPEKSLSLPVSPLVLSNDEPLRASRLFNIPRSFPVQRAPSDADASRPERDFYQLSKRPLFPRAKSGRKVARCAARVGDSEILASESASVRCWRGSEEKKLLEKRKNRLAPRRGQRGG